MRSERQIKAEIAALKALRPTPTWAAKTKASITLAIEELEYGVDHTADEWNDLTAEQQELVMVARNWKYDNKKERPSKGWGILVEKE